MKNQLSIIRKYYPQVRTWSDAKKDATFHVSDEDSKKSQSKSVDHCALAEACKRDYDGAIISKAVAYLVQGTKAIRYRVPAAIQRELVSFDRHHYFAPGTYKLKAPTKTRATGADKRTHAERVANAGKRGPLGKAHTRRNHMTTGLREL